MTLAYTSTLFDHDVDTVWSVLGDFHGLPPWVGIIRESVPEDGDTPGAVGSVRRLTVDPDGHTTRERLLAYDGMARKYSYGFADEPRFRVSSYVGTLRALPVTETGQTFVEWYGEFDALPDADAERLTATFIGIYTRFLADLRGHLTARAATSAEPAVTGS